MRIGLLSNENLPRNVNWTTLSDPLYDEIEAIADAVRIAPPPPSIGNAGAYWRELLKARGVDATFAMFGSWRNEGPLLALAGLAGRVLRTGFYVDPFRPELDKIRRGNRLFGIDIGFLPYREALEELAPGAPAGRYRYLPFAADLGVFRDRALERDIDITWMGRRHEPLHEAMLAYCDANGLNYQFRERTGFLADPDDLGKLASRSRYFVCIPSDLGTARNTGGFSPLIMRYMEGLAAGCRLLGVLPRSGEFEEHLPRGSILELAPDGSDFAEKFAADADESAWRADVEEGTRITRQSFGWDSRARTIVDMIGAALENR